MSIGIRIHDFGKHEPHRLAALLKEYDIHTGQLAIPKAIDGVDSYAEVNQEVLQEIKDAFNENSISVGVLGCYVEPSLPEEAERQAELARFREGIRCGAFLQAGCIGTETTPFEGSDVERAQRFSLLCHSVEQMLRDAEPYKLTVAVEPVHTHTLNSPELTVRLLEKFIGNDLAVIFDAVNLLAADKITMQQAWWAECLEAFGEKIVACHIKDVRLVDGVQIPCPLGEGVVEYAGIATWLRKHKPNIPLLREEICLQTAKQDLDFMRKTFG